MPATRPLLSRTDRIDLRPLVVHPAAADIVRLARHQLNKTFEQYCLFLPDPVPTDSAATLRRAGTRSAEALDIWADTMPRCLVPFILAILRQTQDRLDVGRRDYDAISIALINACEFLLLGRPNEEAMAI
jgi:hypothetical protein